MRVETVNKYGKSFTMMVENDQGFMRITLNGIVSEKVWYSEKSKVYFAPFQLEGVNYWVTVYNGKPRVIIGGESMLEEDFLRDYAQPAFSKLLGCIYVFFALILPCLAIGIASIYFKLNVSKGVYVVLLTTGYLWYALFNASPIEATKKRRQICLISLAAPMLCGLVFLLTMLL